MKTQEDTIMETAMAGMKDGLLAEKAITEGGLCGSTRKSF